MLYIVNNAVLTEVSEVFSFCFVSEDSATKTATETENKLQVERGSYDGNQFKDASRCHTQGRRFFECQFCNKLFMKKISLRHHERKKHLTKQGDNGHKKITKHGKNERKKGSQKMKVQKQK